jgi:hypothetical protein
MFTTPEVKLDDTLLEFPPLSNNPHVITLPLFFNAANANRLEYTVITSDVRLAETELESPP